MVRLNQRIALALMCFFMKIDFNKFMCHKTKNMNRKHSFRYCLLCLNSERDLIEHEELVW